MTNLKFLWEGLRTDLAVEAREMFWQQSDGGYSGLMVSDEVKNAIAVSRVEVCTAKAAQILHKPQGKYVTLTLADGAGGGWYDEAAIEEVLADELKRLLGGLCGTVLVVGLGNRAITADSLGAKMLDEIVVTRHLMSLLPQKVCERINLICSVEPGVFGVTGMETFEVVSALVRQIKPVAVIAVDALAAASTKRLNTTIQLADTGIHPGSGVDNKRYGLNKETLGVPVLAVGIPTVVHASTIALDMIHILEQHAAFSRYFKSLESLAVEERRNLLRQLLPEYMNTLIVSPKEADVLMETMGRVLANGIHKAVYGDFDYQHIEKYLN